VAAAEAGAEEEEKEEKEDGLLSRRVRGTVTPCRVGGGEEEEERGFTLVAACPSQARSSPSGPGRGAFQTHKRADEWVQLKGHLDCTQSQPGLYST
jgi:hypothetical protein